MPAGTKHHLRILFSLLVLVTILSGCDQNCGCDGQCDQMVKVFKFDESIQCEDQGISLEEMAQELTDAGIKINCSQKGSDGLLYIALCGQPTGSINIYEISDKDLDKALTLGFAPVDTLPEYKDTPCDKVQR